MTDEARRLYYTSSHWEGIVNAILTRLKKAHRNPSASISSIRSMRDRLYYCEIRRIVCSQGDLIINGINFGLMLEGLRTDTRRDIDIQFEKAFRFIAFKNSLLDAARAMREMTEGFKFPEELLRLPDYAGAARRAGYYRSKLPFPANIISDTLQAGIDILTPKPELKIEDVFDKDNFSMDLGSPEGDRSVYVFHDANGKRWEVDEKDIDIKHNTDGTANITVYNAHRYGHK